MANVLTQSEIDNLLNALSSGEDVSSEQPSTAHDSKTARLYDFRTANKFYKEQMRTLNVIFDNFAYLLSNKLTGMLRTICEVEVMSVEEQIFGEFNNSIPSPVILGVIEMDPFQGSILMEVSSALAFGFISRLFGGFADYVKDDKSFTEIELVIMENILHQIMEIMRESWEKVISVNPLLTRIETSSQFTQITATNEPAAIVTLDVKVDKVQGMISLCIPHFAIQPVAKDLNTISWQIASNANLKDQQRNLVCMREQVENTYVTLKTTFEDTDTNLSDIMTMKVGDVIRINHRVDELVTVSVEHIPKFMGVVGVSGNKYVVQVAKIVKENEDIEQ